MNLDIVSYNKERDRLQKALDAQKTSKERNMKGQLPLHTLWHAA